MATATAPLFEPSQVESRALARAVRWSFGVHVAAVVVLFVIPPEWLAKEPPKKPMTITLGGTAGPRSTGTTSLGGRAVEQAVPTPRRPEPIRPTPKAEPVPAPPTKTPPVPAKPAEIAKATPPPQRAPTTGPQVSRGNTVVDTAVTGQGIGLSFGGDGAGGETDVKDFCCPEYLEFLRAKVDLMWNKHQPYRGVAVVKFTIRRDGTITDVVLESPSGVGVLDRAARGAVTAVRQITPLPAAHVPDTLTIHLKFPYEGS